MNLKDTWDAIKVILILVFERHVEPVLNNPPDMTLKPALEDPDALLDWHTVEGAHHNVRALCDLEGLTWNQKQILVACVKVESGFNIHATHANRDGKGNILSTDFGIAQINSYWNIGKGKPFPSADYVLTHPAECIRFMCKSYKQNGDLRLWCSFTSGAYKQWLGKV